MDLSDVLKNVNTYIGDTSEDRLSAEDRYQAVTEATAWLLEELGNEHMVDRASIEYIPSVMWYKMDNLTPYLLTAGQLRYKEEDEGDRGKDFTRVDPRDLVNQPKNRHSYAIERYNADSYLGIIIPPTEETTTMDLIGLNEDDGLTYTGVNAINIVEEKNAIRFDMENTGVTQTGLETTSSSIDLSNFQEDGIIVFEVEIPDIDDVTSVSVKFGEDLSTDYYLGTVTQDVNGNALAEGVNTIKVRLSEVTTVGSPSLSTVTEWGFYVNHDSAKVVAENFRLSDLRIADPIYLTFKYIFYRVGKDASGSDIIEFSANDDVPFFMDRYPQYRFAVAHKAASTLFRSMQDYSGAGSEESQANKSLKRYLTNFTQEKDQGSSCFKPAGVSFRSRRIIKRR
jgi:hypothetical protein